MSLCVRVQMRAGLEGVTNLWQEAWRWQRLRGILMTQLEKATYRPCVSLSRCSDRIRLSSSLFEMHLQPREDGGQTGSVADGWPSWFDPLLTPPLLAP